MTVHLTLSVFGVHNIEDICSKFGKKMQHGHAEMPMWPKRNRNLICMTSLRRLRATT